MALSSTHSYDEDRQFRCTYCQKSFRRLEHLQRHTRRHTNEKPFTCCCGASFSRRDLLRRHERMIDHSNAANAPSRVSDDSDLSIHDIASVSTPQNRAVTNTITQKEQANCPQTSDSPIYSTSVTHARSLSAPFTPVEDPSLSHFSNETPPQAELYNSQNALWENNAGGNYAHEFPTIFPFPYLSLATQIVPHCVNPTVTDTDRSRLLASLGRLGEASPSYDLPPSSALTRYMAGYFMGAYPRSPFSHGPTFKLESCSPAFCLAMTALGAIDRFEYASATQLFHYSKALLFDGHQYKARSQMNRAIGVSSMNIDNKSQKQSMDEVRCLLCLAQFASWHSDSSIRAEAYMLQSLLVQGLRSSGLEETTDTLQHLNWEEWAQRESDRRTKLFAFCFLGVQNIAYDMPPSILCDEINLQLPCSCPEWTAPDQTTWELLRGGAAGEPRRFNDTVEQLLSTQPVDPQSTQISPVGNYVVMHGLLSKILWSRRSMSGSLSQTLSTNFQSVLESALQKWTLSWQQTPESNLEPLDPNGPLPFTSSALLSLAYIRKCFNVSQRRRILTWTPFEIAPGFQDSLPVDRTHDSLLAAYHATNLLSTLVKLGVQYFKYNQAILWGIESALCGLNCSIFLEKWLRNTQTTVCNEPLTDHESRLIYWIEEVVREGLSSTEDHMSYENRQAINLPDKILELWSHIMDV
ncbi:hypothetical protein MW887_006240 [Aspergillus wentii]|nr:hypothetical protein MW887_006240 [Aspergillus wentii]